MKFKTIPTLMILAALTFSSVMSKADEVAMPVISTPSALQEGLQRELSAEQIAELLPWAKDSKIFMNDLLDGLENYDSETKIEKLIDGIKYIVVESAPKNSELLMRYALNRGLALYDILAKETDASAVGVPDAKIRILIQSIKMASKYVDQDILSMTQKKPRPFAEFGAEYFSFICELNKSIIDASAQYLILRTSLEYLQWDLYRDLNNKEFSNHIVKINNALKKLPNKSLKDSVAISSIREMKRIIESLKLEEKFTSIKAIKDAEIKAKRDAEESTQHAAKDIINKNSPLAAGDIVIYGTTVRVVEFVSDDGKAALQGDSHYNRTVVSVSSIQKTLRSYDNFTIGDAVIYENSIRVVEYLGNKGAAVLSGDSHYNRTYVYTDAITKTVSASGKYHVGNKVLYSNAVRVIEYLDDKGRIVLAGDSTHNRTYVTAGDVSKIL